MGLFDKLFGKNKSQKNEMQQVNTPSAKLQGTFSPLSADVISLLESGRSYHLEHNDEMIDFFSDHLDYRKKLYGNTVTTIPYDVKDFSSFRLDKIEAEIKDYWCAVKIDYYSYSGATITSHIIMSFDQKQKKDVSRIVEYVATKIQLKHRYDEEQKRIAEQTEYERVHGKHRYSKMELPKMTDTSSGKALLIESYKDVKLVVNNELHLQIINIDLQITIKTEDGVCKVSCEKNGSLFFLGAIEDQGIRDVLTKVEEKDSLVTTGIVSLVDENEGTVSVDIGIYYNMSTSAIKSIPYVDESLTKTSKKDEFDMSRQDNLDCVSEGDEVSIEYQRYEGGYLVTDSQGNELGEIGEGKSDKISDLIKSEPEYIAFILETSISDTLKTKAKVRVMRPVYLEDVLGGVANTTSSKKKFLFSCTKLDVTAMIAEQLKNSFISFDIETTGLSPARDRIVELGAVRFENGVPVDRYSTLIKTDVPISPEAQRINNISNEMLMSAPGEEEAYSKFVEFLGKATEGKLLMCAHNASFDFGFIESTFKRLRIDADLKYVDTLALCRHNVPGLDNYKQNTLERHFGIQNSSSHRAETDAEACGKILLEALKLGESKYQEEKQRIEANAPDTDELEICAVIYGILNDAGADTAWLRFRKSSSTIDGTCLYPFISFKIVKKGRYIIVPSEIADKSGMVCETCINSEGGAKNKRVYFSSPLEIETFKDHIIKEYKNAYKNMKSYTGHNKRAMSEALSFISEWYQFEESEVSAILLSVSNKDYSYIKIPEVEATITHDDVRINAVFDRIPFDQITIKTEWDSAGQEFYSQAEDKRKAKQFEEALELYAKARAEGLITHYMYTGFAQAYHGLKDYDNEIVILDEGIEHLNKQSGDFLITRRNTALKALYKIQEAERLVQQKAEEKRLKQEKKEAEKLKKAEKPSESQGRLVIQMDDDGNVIAEYPSVSEASKSVGISPKSIRDAAKGVQKHAAGFCWKYKDEEEF